MLNPDSSEHHPASTAKEKSATESHTVPEIVEASVKGEDEPMEREHPTAPGALVWFTFPALLIVAILVTLVVVAFMQRG